MNDAKQDQEKYARRSFSMRRMTSGQVRALTIGAALFLVLLVLAYSFG